MPTKELGTFYLQPTVPCTATRRGNGSSRISR